MTYIDGGDRNQVRLIIFDVIGSRPGFGIAGRLFWATDENLLYRDTGGAWEVLGAAVAPHAPTHQTDGSDETRNIEWLTDLADLGYSGNVSIVTAGEIVLAGDGLYLYNDGKYYKSDASASNTMPVKVMALAGAAADADVLVLHDGYYRNDTLYDWTPGDGIANLLWADVNAGLFVQTAAQPAGSGDMVQVVGWIVNENQLCFRPSLELVEHP